MVDSTKDILFLALTLATVVLTFFLAWFLYYLVSIIRQAHAVMKQVSESVARLHTILDSIKETINRSSSHLGLIVSALKELLGFYTRRRKRQKSDSSDKNKT